MDQISDYEHHRSEYNQRILIELLIADYLCEAISGLVHAWKKLSDNPPEWMRSHTIRTVPFEIYGNIGGASVITLQSAWHCMKHPLGCNDNRLNGIPDFFDPESIHRKSEVPPLWNA